MNILNFMFLKFHLSSKLCPQSGVSSSRVSSKSHVLKVACPQSRMSSKSCVLKVVCPQSGVFKVVSSKWSSQSGVSKVESSMSHSRLIRYSFFHWACKAWHLGKDFIFFRKKQQNQCDGMMKHTYQSIITSECFTLTTWYTWYLLDLLGKMSKSFTNSFSTLALWPQKLIKFRG